MAKILRFDNGLRVCYERRRGSGSCAFGVYVAAGSRDEDADSNGVAHFIEHMLWKGTERRTAAEIAEAFDRLGANSNAFTSKTNTCYYAYGLAKYLPEYMDVLSDMLFHSTFTAENIEKERGVVLEEIKMYDDEGDSVCSDLMSLSYYGKNKLGRPILGTEKTVKGLQEEKIRRFMAKYYVPDNIGLAYAGPASEAEFRALVDRYFTPGFDALRGTGVKRSRRTAKISPNAFFVKRFDKPFEQANVIVRFPSYPAEDKREPVAMVLASILGGGMSSRLFQKVREDSGLVYEIYSMTTAIRGDGYLTVAFACAPECAEKAVLKVREVLETAKAEGFTQEEFDKIRADRETVAVLGEETAFSVMRLMGRQFCLTGKPITYRECLRQLEDMTLADVKAAFDEIVRYENAAVAYVGKPIGADLRKTLMEGK